MSNALAEVLSLAPFGIHVVRKKISRLSSMDHNVGLGDRAAYGLPRVVELIFIKSNGMEHIKLDLSFPALPVEAVDFAGGFDGL